ncbi:class I SAM-dependent methyltransferase [Thalassotalea profundi]|uniref:SAM-dependent methyltransferase n=1 Tax=Thalassotalea profundi TaxID=2036687 RepID=A0ABQ3IH13_9GAMM|nr:class I SAM-dependent methyltransferase [Thalassotalea profundi]GHE83076.1 SAM-dependent methyltransferase [Thalassotalea profundi]
MWDQRYGAKEFAYGTSPNDFLKEQYSCIPKGGNVLCLAEGEGRNAVFLAKLGYVVTAVDQSPVGLEKAQAYANENGVEITTVVTDLADYDIGEKIWDGIVSISAHVPSVLRKKIHQQVVRGLKPKGVFILEAYTEHQLVMSGIGGPPASQRDLFMSLNALKIELKGLHFNIGNEVERFISEGEHHQGESAVVQVVAYKDI